MSPTCTNNFTHSPIHDQYSWIQCITSGETSTQSLAVSQDSPEAIPTLIPPRVSIYKCHTWPSLSMHTPSHDTLLHTLGLMHQPLSCQDCSGLQSCPVAVKSVLSSGYSTIQSSVMSSVLPSRGQDRLCITIQNGLVP